MNFFDAKMLAWLEREILRISKIVTTIDYPALKGQILVPQNRTVPSHRSAVEIEEIDRVGVARISANLANDFPLASIAKKTTIKRAYNHVSAYEFSYDEVKLAMESGSSLDDRDAGACRDTIEAGLDKSAAIGSVEHGYTGLLNAANVSVSASSASWLTATADQIIADVSAAMAAIGTQTKDTYKADTLVVPTGVMARLATLKVSANDSMTVLDFLRNSTKLLVESWSYADTAGVGGVGRAVLYARNPRVLEWIVLADLEEVGREFRGGMTKVNLRGKDCGVAFYKPMAAVYIDGVK